MNYPIWELPAPGLLIAVVAIVHVFIAHIAVGGGLFLVVAETLLRRERDEEGLACLATLGNFFVKISLVLGTITGVGIWFTISVVQPAAVSWLLDVFLWAWVIEWVFFAVEVTAALVYYHGWERLSPATHVAVGWVYFVSAWLSLAAINGILGFMLTPGAWLSTHSFWDGLFNPVYFSTLAARTATALVLAGLYVLFAASWMPAGPGLDRLRRLAAWGYVLPGAVILPLTFVWFLAASGGAGVALEETFGTTRSGWTGALAGVLQSGPASGIPMAKTMARATLGSLVALAAIVAAGLALHRARFGRPMTALLLVLGFVGIGGGEFVRENLRRPFVLANLMFVNGVELPVRGLGGPSPFTIDSLERDGALAAARWVRWPEAVAAARAGQAPVRLPPPADPVLRGEALFRLQCACCHTLGGHLGIRKLVKGRDERTLQYVLSRLARPAGAGGKPADWAEPGVRLETWLGRRMPPFAGTEGERQELATYLAGLGGASPDPGLETRGSRPEERLASPVESSRPAEKSGGSGTEVMPATTATSAGAGASEPDGKALFEERCAMCHAADADWPMAARVRGRPASTFFELLGKLPEINADMEPFEGSEAERRALAAFLSGLGSDAGRLK